MKQYDIKGWIKNAGGLRIPHGFIKGELVDVIHRDGEVFYSLPVGNSSATDFKHWSRHSGADVIYFRKSCGESAGKEKVFFGKPLLEAIEGVIAEGIEPADKESKEVDHTELHVDSRTFHGLIEAISRDKPNTWSFNAGGKSRPYRTLTIGNTIFIELTEEK
ncbi:hypothetical protein KASHIRA_00350 [Serratia phage vB_SmaM-Kashira]|nr:hypothetical protein KASHIRA_00350 [Serratia phage vB_SmaM-Kashira]